VIILKGKSRPRVSLNLIENAGPAMRAFVDSWVGTQWMDWNCIVLLFTKWRHFTTTSHMTVYILRKTIQWKD